MARNSQEDFSGQSASSEDKTLEINANNSDRIEVPGNNFIADSEITRDGQDLILEAENGETIVINGYFSSDPAPMIEAPDGSILTPNLVNSFLQSSDQYAQASTMTDESPVGAVEEISGSANVIRADGTSEPITLGTPIFKGDVIETAETGAVNIVFIDETSMAVSENARLSVDEYKFDPSTESGETNFSVLRGVFVFTSGLIGRDDPDDVKIETPVGSIGIRGTIIAGKIQPGGESEITVVEGAIVVKNGAMEKTLSVQYESIKLGGFNDNMQDLGIKDTSSLNKSYGSISDVVPNLFSTINNTTKENTTDNRETKSENTSEENLVEDTKEEIKFEEPQEQVNEEPTSALNLNSVDQTKTFESVNQIKLDNRIQIKESLKESEFKAFNSSNFVNPNIINKNFIPQEQATPNSPIFAFGADGARYFVSSGNPNAGKIFADFNGDGIKDTASIDFGTGDLNINSIPTGTILNDSSVDYIKLSLVGDIDNDGYADIIASNPDTSDGTVYEVWGSSSAPTINPIVGTNLGDKYGYSVAGIGDFNGDGKSDYAVGSIGVNASDGEVFLNLSTASDLTISGSGAQKLGAFVSGVGDINGDGFSDIMYGSQSAGSNKVANIAFGNVNGTHNTISVTGDSPIIAGGAAGDMNGDGYDDFAISMKDGNAVNTYVIFGDGTLSNLTMTELNDPSQAHALKIRHEGAGSATGYTINSVGDKDGDGFDDLQIGIAGGAQFTVHGRVHDTTDTSIVRDGINDSNGNPNEISAGSTGASLVGNAAKFYDGAFGNVSMKGGNVNNRFYINDAEFRNIDGGKGIDTIIFDTPGGNLDFSGINFETISQIEAIEFGQTGQTIILTAENIFNLLKSSDDGILRIENKDGISGSQFKIDAASVTGGSTSNVVTALNEAGDGATFSGVTGDGYNHFNIGGYNLYIDTNITTTVI